MTAALVILATALAVSQQTPQRPAQQADPAKTMMFTGCVIAAPDREDSFQLVAAEPEPGRPVGTSGTSPAWTVPAYLLLGGVVSAEHLLKTVEIVGTVDPAPAPAEPDPKKTGDTTARTQQAAAPMAQMHVQTVKVVASTCTPKKLK